MRRKRVEYFLFSARTLQLIAESERHLHDVVIHRSSTATSTKKERDACVERRRPAWDELFIFCAHFISSANSRKSCKRADEGDDETKGSIVARETTKEKNEKRISRTRAKNKKRSRRWWRQFAKFTTTFAEKREKIQLMACRDPKKKWFADDSRAALYTREFMTFDNNLRPSVVWHSFRFSSAANFSVFWLCGWRAISARLRIFFGCSFASTLLVASSDPKYFDEVFFALARRAWHEILITSHFWSWFFLWPNGWKVVCSARVE